MKAPRNILTFNSLGRYGRFANGMFQIAGTIGIARKNGLDFAFPPWFNHDHADRFGSTEDIDLQKYFANPLPIYSGPALPDHPISWGYQDVRLNQSVSLSGHMQSEKYFSHCIDEVRWYFKAKHEQDCSEYCAIHIRLGDYDNAYHPRLGWEYYGAAIDLMPKGTKFMVFSDDTKAAAKMLNSNCIRISVYEGNYIHSFDAMKSCRHFIIGNSSYSLMAAILGTAKDKQVVAPAPWFGPAWGRNYRDMERDIYSPGWHVVNWENKFVTA